MGLIEIALLCGGLAFFLFGMNVMSSGLEKMAGGKLEGMLRKSTSNPVKSMSLGAGITIAIQSSSAVTVMLVGLVNSGIMVLGQTIGVIMGSNIGTTLTAWILALNGVESDGNQWMNLLKPEVFSLFFSLIGIAMTMMCKKDKSKSIGSIMVGFGVLMYGMEMMGNAVEPLKSSESFAEILTAFNNPLVGVLVGAVFTGVIQSSAASVGILMNFAATGKITFGMAIPIIMGQNIGTCVTALISSIGVNKNAKKVAVVHILFNLIGTAIFLSLYCLGNWLFDFTFNDSEITPVWIAAVHTIFNVCTTLILMPFAKLLEKMANSIVRDGKDKQTVSFLDERLLATPGFAIAECGNKTAEMARLAQDTFTLSVGQLWDYHRSTADKITKNEDALDNYEDKLSTVLVQLSGASLSDADSRKAAKLLHTIGDFERIGDHAVNLLEVAKEIHEKSIAFSSSAQKELQIATDALTRIVEITMDSFCNSNLELAKRVEPLEQTIDELISDVKARHIERLQKGKCTIQLCFVLSDILNNYERISDHCSNIAVAMIETQQNAYEAHEYLNELKEHGDAAFQKDYVEFKQEFSLQ